MPNIMIIGCLMIGHDWEVVRSTKNWIYEECYECDATRKFAK